VAQWLGHGCSGLTAFIYSGFFEILIALVVLLVVPMLQFSYSVIIYFLVLCSQKGVALFKMASVKKL